MHMDNSPTSSEGRDPLLTAAEERLTELKVWAPRLWAWNCWLTGAAMIFSGLVPFGLGLLLYIPSAYARTLNIILIVGAAIGFVAQVWNVTQRNRDRAQNLRNVTTELEWAVASYRGGVIDREGLSNVYRKALERYAQEPAP